MSLGYGYNSVGEMTELKDGLQNAFQAKYAYDTLGRLSVIPQGQNGFFQQASDSPTFGSQEALVGNISLPTINIFGAQFAIPIATIIFG